MKTFFIATAAIGTIACSTPQMLVDAQLTDHSFPMPVKGRQGWMINQKLEFGPFSTGKISRGWTRSHNLDLMLIGFQGTKEKYSFTITDGNGQLTALCANQVKGIDIPIDRLVNPYTSRDLFSFTIETRDVFTASIFDHDGSITHNLLVANRDDFRKNGKYVGMITSYDSHPVMIVPVRELHDQKTVSMDVVGYEFREGEKLLGAVEILNEGRVWIADSLDDNKKLLLAAASATLLLQSDLHYHAET